MPRKFLPSRRHSWTTKARFGNQTFYLTCGEYENGKLGEVFLDASKQGTFLRGVIGTLARVMSLSLQWGVPVSELVKLLKGLDYPPQGPVEDTDLAISVKSVADWIAQELEEAYCA